MSWSILSSLTFDADEIWWTAFRRTEMNPRSGELLFKNHILDTDLWLGLSKPSQNNMRDVDWHWADIAGNCWLMNYCDWEDRETAMMETSLVRPCWKPIRWSIHQMLYVKRETGSHQRPFPKVDLSVPFFQSPQQWIVRHTLMCDVCCDWILSHYYALELNIDCKL
jgi:hypothetical protein